MASKNQKISAFKSNIVDKGGLARANLFQVDLDFPDKVNDLVVPFIEKKGLKSEVVLLNDDDHNRWIPLVSDKWSGAIPATVVVKNGQAVFKEGSHTYESLQTDIQSIL